MLAVLALAPACSFVFVKEPKQTPPQVPLECTASNALPLADAVIGAVLGGLVFATTYAAIDSFNDECTGGCYRPWKPALLATFLVVSPWGISSIVGLSDTARCRKAYRERGQPPP